MQNCKEAQKIDCRYAGQQRVRVTGITATFITENKTITCIGWIQNIPTLYAV